MWDMTRINFETFRNYVCVNWLKIATNSQLSERRVKHSNESTATRKDEKN